jgi:hypothetical protein
MQQESARTCLSVTYSVVMLLFTSSSFIIIASWENAGMAGPPITAPVDTATTAGTFLKKARREELIL